MPGKDNSIPYLRIVGSKGSDIVGDCGICAIGTLTGRTYEDVVAVASQISKNWKAGLWLREIEDIARELGLTLRRKRKYDLDSDVGILDVEILDRRKREPHVVVLNAGRIIDSDYTIWDAEAYLIHYKAKAKTLLTPD